MVKESGQFPRGMSQGGVTVDHQDIAVNAGKGLGKENPDFMIMVTATMTTGTECLQQWVIILAITVQVLLLGQVDHQIHHRIREDIKVGKDKGRDEKLRNSFMEEMQYLQITSLN